MSQPIIVEQESNSALLFVGALVAGCIGRGLSQNAPQATTNPVTPQPTRTQWVTAQPTPQVTGRRTDGPGAQQGSQTAQTSGEVGTQQYGNTPLGTTAPGNVPETPSTNLVPTTPALPPPNPNLVQEKETYAPSQIYETRAAGTPSPTVLGSQTIVPASTQAVQTPAAVPSSCPAVCRQPNDYLCTWYMSQFGYCGDDEHGWGPGAVERYTSAGLLTDCRGCGGAVDPPGKYCEGGVCVKRPPNCFGARSVDDCYSCEEAKNAYAQNRWMWPGNEPDAKLFCSKWP